MTEEQRDNSLKKFNQLISKSSQKLLSSFLSDNEKKKKESKLLREQIELAATQKKNVILQIKSQNNTSETLTGQLFYQNSSVQSVGIKVKPTNELKIIQINNIKKIRIMTHSPSNKKAL